MGRLRAFRSSTFMMNYPSILRFGAVLIFWWYWILNGAYSSYRLTKSYGKRVRIETGIHEVRQFLWQWWWAIWYSIQPKEFYAFALYRKENAALLGQFLYLFETGGYSGVKTGSPELQIAASKKAFAAFCTKHNLPCVSHRAIGGRAGEITVSDMLEECLQAPFFLKPVSGYGGRENFIVKADGDGIVLEDADGLARVLSRNEAEEVLQRRFRRQEYLAQPLLCNHRDLQGFSLKGISTLRVITLLTKPGSNASYFMAALQVPRSKDDNISNRGFFCPVDEVTGVLGKGLRPVVMSSISSFHPDSGVIFEGRKVPCWEEAKTLAINAHTRLQAFSSLAWDIAITNKGLFLLETNLGWGAGIMQRSFEVPLGETAFPTLVANYLEIR